MLIIHRLDDFLFTIFPEIDWNDHEAIIKRLETYYSYGNKKPNVKIDNDFVIIEIDTSDIEAQEADYNKTIALCEQGKYTEAKKLLDNLIKKDSTNSEYHRIYGQILSDEGDQDGATDELIEALRWDPKNKWALLMIGNVLAKYKQDISTALKYYDQVIKIDPEDNIALNNIGANLIQLGNASEAKKYFDKALQLNPEYPNTHYALALMASNEGDDYTAFNKAIDAIKRNARRDDLYRQGVKLAFDSAAKLIRQDEAFEHLVMHEIAHIDLATQARSRG